MIMMSKGKRERIMIASNKESSLTPNLRNK